MEFLLAITIGVLYAAAFYLLLRRGVVRIILGIALLSQAVNLLIFTAGGLREGGVPFIAEGQTARAGCPSSRRVKLPWPRPVPIRCRRR